MSCKKIEIDDLTIDLTAGKAPRRLVDRLTLTIAGGDTVALVGESGAGKSMTSLAVMNLLPPGIARAGGEITVNHQPTSRLDAEGWRRLRNRDVAMIMQNPMSAFDPVFDIFSHFRETLRAHGEYRSRRAAFDRAEAALDEAGLENPGAALSLYPFQMSGGMLQRVMIGLALLLDPDFLVADEPTTDLDTVAQSRILRLLRERKRKRHLGMLLVTHDLSAAAFLADTVAVMRHGRLVEYGPAAEVFERPRHPYTRELLAAHRDLYGPRFRRLAAMPDAPRANEAMPCA